MEALVQNGITVDDLQKNYELGYNAGFGAASEPTVKSCYAAIVLALADKGMTQDECFEVLVSVDRYILETLTSMEACDMALERTGIELDFEGVSKVCRKGDWNDE